MVSLDLSDILMGVLLAIVLLAPLAWLIARAWQRQGEAMGRLSREPEIAHLVAERQSLRDELVGVRRLLDEQSALAQHLRETGERLGNERSALAVRAERVDVLEQSLSASRADAEQTAWQVADLRARLEEQQRAATERLRELESARERMKTEFQVLAAEILEDKAKTFSERSGEQLGLLLNPLREQLGDFRKSVNEAYEKESGARIALQTEVRQLMELNRRLGDEAQGLTRALTADSRSQGYWGELKLERLLELAGLERGREYVTQESYRDSDGDLYRPDAIIKLPGGRDIVVDAKVALTDYQLAASTAEADERDAHLDRHTAAIRRHVIALGAKDYSRLDGVQSPELVFMFVPVEGAFLEALRRDSSLYDDAFKRSIILVGPSNLLASLRLVAQIWRTEDQNRNAQLIAERAGALYDKFVGFVDDLIKVGDALDRAQKMQQAAVQKLAHGKGNLVRRAEQLRSLGVAPGKQLPPGLLAMSDPAIDDADGDGGNDDGADRSTPSA
jgi:DNA recombination protein RmuC